VIYEGTLDATQVNTLIGVIKDQPLKFVVDTKQEQIQVQVGLNPNSFFQGIITLTKQADLDPEPTPAKSALPMEDKLSNRG
jgi:hypothetical protein